MFTNNLFFQIKLATLGLSGWAKKNLPRVSEHCVSDPEIKITFKSISLG